MLLCVFFFFSSRRRHTRWTGDWSSDVCSSDLDVPRRRCVRAGRAWWCSVARSYAAATRNIVASANELAMICSPTGRQIGRASCRERGWIEGGGGGAKKKRGNGSDLARL